MIHLSSVRLVRLTIILALLLSSITISKAQKPSDPPPGTEQTTESTSVAKTEMFRSATSLAESLSDEQKQAIQTILKRYEPEVASMVEQLPPLPEQERAGKNQVYMPTILASRPVHPNGTAAESLDSQSPEPQQETHSLTTIQTIQKANVSLSAINDRISEEVAAVLSPEQQALHHSALASFKTPSVAAANTMPASENTTIAGDVAVSQTVNIDKDRIWDSTLYATYALYNNAIAYEYAYYYIISGVEVSEDANAAFNYFAASYNYSLLAHYYLSATFFTLQALDIDYHQVQAEIYSNLTLVIDHSYNGYILAYRDYLITQSAYLYTALYYGYYTYDTAVTSYQSASQGFGWATN